MHSVGPFVCYYIPQYGLLPQLPAGIASDRKGRRSSDVTVGYITNIMPLPFAFHAGNKDQLPRNGGTPLSGEETHTRLLTVRHIFPLCQRRRKDEDDRFPLSLLRAHNCCPLSLPYSKEDDNKVAGHFLRDRVRSSAIRELLLLHIKRSQSRWLGHLYRMPSSGGVPGMSHLEEAQGMAQDTLEGLCLSAGLGTPWAPHGGAGGGVWGEGRLGVSPKSAAPATRSRIKRKTTRCDRQLPGTCEPTGGTYLSSRSPARKNLVCPTSNFTYTTWKKIRRNNNHLIATSPIKFSLRSITHLPPETPPPTK
ncbi:hypothetical protein AMECASPLE_015026 [Ameca splendens]|uniref:Uncharacterized protein n=1 Tax=Ameca splendens TaxID=208324 RepID=A0ABV0YD03_9TELE